MITYFIISKLGPVIYESNTNNINIESNQIRFLPLLLIKDLVKANLNDVIQYIRLGKKTIVFKEQQELVYIACSTKQNKPLPLLHSHLAVMHNFLTFHYGPHWPFQILGESNRGYKGTINKLDLSSCLSHLPFIQRRVSINSCDNFCSTEQIQISEDLQLRLIDNITHLCNTIFIKKAHPFYHHHHHHRHSLFHPNKNNFNPLLRFDQTWSSCYLFAKEKLVLQCHSYETKNRDEIYFLKLLVSHYLHEKCEAESIYDETITLPQNISPSNSSFITKMSGSPSSSSTITPTNFNPILSPTKSDSSLYTTYKNSSLVYNANSNSIPFKIKEKSTSSVTVVSSDTQTYWDSKTIYKKSQKSLITELLLQDEMKDERILSSSISTLNEDFNDLNYPNSIYSSAPSSPLIRSRSHSVSDEPSTLKSILTDLMHGSYLEDDIKLVQRWIKVNNQYCLTNILLIILNHSLYSIVILKNDIERLNNNVNTIWKPSSNGVKQFKSSLNYYLSDFSQFLSTKESTHFTIISFALTYPGLIHFIYFKHDMMTQPLLVDLNEVDTNHELLHEIYEKYSCMKHKRWPNKPNLTKLCNEILEIPVKKNKKVMKISKDNQYYFIRYKENYQDLLAIYFNVTIPDQLWIIHKQLMIDMGQRSL